MFKELIYDQWLTISDKKEDVLNQDLFWNLCDDKGTTLTI